MDHTDSRDVTGVVECFVLTRMYLYSRFPKDVLFIVRSWFLLIFCLTGDIDNKWLMLKTPCIYKISNYGFFSSCMGVGEAKPSS
jgi:hypothetical protein